MIRKLVVIALFLIGLSIFLYPTVMKFYHNYTMSRESEAMTEQFQVDSEDQRAAYNNFAHYNATLSRTEAISTPPVEVRKQQAGRTSENKEGVIATVDIPALDIHYPVYDKATPENLDLGVSRVDGTSYPVGGLSSNSVLAAHSYSPDHEWFTHIDKLEDGAIVIINNFKETLYYEVVAREIITPHEVDKLAIREGEDMITLLTCTVSGEDRVLVYAERTSPPAPEEVRKPVTSGIAAPTIEQDKHWLDDVKVVTGSSWMIAIALLLIALFMVLLKRRK
ncbi:class C sortase [Salinicoccus sp. ID82-1]|nr:MULTISPECIES: class C sortase [Salinicoccus]MCG1009617.1 class C sortase [Salinicoccus sp. ID82-1]